MRRCWTALAALAALEKNPAHKNDYERQARWFKAMSRPPGRIPGRRKDGLDVLVKQLADFYTERTDRPAGRSRSKNGGAPGGPFVRLVKAVCDLLKLDEVTAEAIATLIGDMGNPQARRN